MTEHSIPVQTHTADLLVVGGGLAGVCTAVSAARHGCRVVLMQDRPVLGGNASSEVRMWICGAQGHDNRETGIVEEILLANMQKNPDKSPYLFDTILLGLVKAEPNITLLLNCPCMDAETDGGKILSVTGYQMTTQTKHRVSAILYADCSGDSILAPLTGAEFRLGREAAAEFGERVSTEEADKKTMGISCLLQARRTDRPSTFTPPVWATEITDEMVENRFFSLDDDYENFWYLELGGEEDCIHDAEKIKDDLLALALGFWNYIKNSGKVKGAEYWQLDFLGFYPAKRESRRMLGDLLVTQKDILAGGHFPDTVGYGGWPLDDHFPGGFFHRGRPNTDFPTPAPYGIPYRALYSRNIENLFFAGRNISMTHAAMSSSRVMATCGILGEAVGVAAALAVKYALTPRGVYEKKLDELQTALLDADCFLPGFTRPVSALAKSAALTCDGMGSPSLDALRNGQDRDHRLFGDIPSGVTVKCGSALTYTLSAPAEVREVRLTFDSDLNRVTLPGSRSEQEHNIRALVRPDSPVMHLPDPLVRAYRLTATLPGGSEMLLADERENALRTVHIPVGKTVTSLTLTPLSTYGDNEIVHLLSFDFR